MDGDQLRDLLGVVQRHEFFLDGSFSSAGNFGEMGFERNGSFVEHDELKEAAAAALHPAGVTHIGGAALTREQSGTARPGPYRTSFLLGL